MSALNTQLANAVADIAVATERLATARGRLAVANREEAAAVNAVNQAQKRFDELVATVKRQTLVGTDWARPDVDAMKRER